MTSPYLAGRAWQVLIWQVELDKSLLDKSLFGRSSLKSHYLAGRAWQVLLWQFLIWQVELDKALFGRSSLTSLCLTSPYLAGRAWQVLIWQVELDKSLFGRRVKWHDWNPNVRMKVWILAMVDRNTEPRHEISNNVVCATSKGSAQPCEYAQTVLSLGWSLSYSMVVELLTKSHLRFLYFKGGCTGSSESTLVKMPHCWKSRVTTQLNYTVSWHTNDWCEYIVGGPVSVRDLFQWGTCFSNLLKISCHFQI